MSVTCRACGRVNAEDAEFCANRDCGAYLGWEGRPHQEPGTGPHAGGATDPGGQPAAGGDQRAGVRATLADTVVAVDPGTSSSTTLSVYNAGTQVEGFTITLSGPAADWGAVEPPEISVYPEQTATVTLRFTPPRASSSPAGRAWYVVRLDSTIHPGLAVTANGAAAVGAYHDVSAELAPATSSGRRTTRHQVVAHNRGNVVEHARLAASDDEGAFRMTLGRSAIEVPPGDVRVPLKVRAQLRWFGRRRSVPIHAALEIGGRGAPLRVDGARHVVPVFPSWAPVALAVVLALAGGGTAALAALARNTHKQHPPAAAAATSRSPSLTHAPASPSPTSASASTSNCRSSPGTSPKGPAGIRNLIVSGSTRRSLIAAFAAYKKIHLAYVAGTAPHSIYYACNPATDTYWAYAEFVPSGSAPLNVKVSFQDGGELGMFTKTGSGAWRVTLGGVPAPCYIVKFFPRAVLMVWALVPTDTSACATPQPSITTSAAPVLGRPWEPHLRGYGEARPEVIDNNGDPTGLVTHLSWSSWGGSEATATGISAYLAPGEITANAKEESARVVAFHLGMCDGRRSYNAVEWFFPQHGQRFNPHAYRNTCTGQYVGNP